MKLFTRAAFLLLLLIMGVTFVACTPGNGNQDNLEGTSQIEDFAPVKPSEMGERDYWELARTFDQLSSQFINAVFSGDNEKVQELILADTSLEIEVAEGNKVVHIKQQAVVYEDGKYNSIMQFGIENEPYRYFHIFFEDLDDEWKISDVQMDA